MVLTSNPQQSICHSLPLVWHSFFYTTVPFVGGQSTGLYHSKEIPVRKYEGLTVHARAQKRDLIDTLFGIGLSIFYDRVMEISMTMNNRVCEQYNCDGVACHTNLHKGYLLWERLIILTITQAQQQTQVLSTVLGYRSFNIPAKITKGTIAENIELDPRHLKSGVRSANKRSPTSSVGIQLFS